MSKYTTELRFICETEANKETSEGYDSINDILKIAAPKIFSFKYPIFDENYRLPLEIKILRYYYTREISEETVGLWKLRLENKMNEIMPYYNQMYKSELLEFNPLYDVDLTRDSNTLNNGATTTENSRKGTQDSAGSRHTSGSDKRDGTNTNNVTSNGNSVRHESGTNQSDGTTHNENNRSENSKTDTTTEGAVNTTNEITSKETGTVDKTTSAWRLYSDTPQGGIEGIAHAEDDIVNMAYLTNATHDTGNDKTSSSTNGNSNGTETQNTNTSGNVTATGTSTDNSDGTTTAKGKFDNSETIDSTSNENGTSITNESGTYDGFETNTVKSTTNQSDKGKSSITNTEEFIEHVKGKQGTGTYSRMLTEFRETFLNIDKMIIEELSTLFFGLWG